MIQYNRVVKDEDLLNGFSYPVGKDPILFKNTVRSMKRNLIKVFHKSPLILVCRGNSGSLICGALCLSTLNVTEVIHIRKPNESSHSSSIYLPEEKEIDKFKIVIVDDFMSSGDTLNAVYSALISRSATIATKGVDGICISMNGGVATEHFIMTDILICGRI